MKTLIIMRHAKTEEGKANQRDFDRELIYKGLKFYAVQQSVPHILPRW